MSGRRRIRGFGVGLCLPLLVACQSVPLASLQVRDVGASVSARVGEPVRSPIITTLSQAFDWQSVDEMVVRFRSGGRTLPGATLKGSLALKNTYVYRLNSRGYALAAVEDWSMQEDIDYVEPNYVYQAVGEPNDPGWDDAWGIGKIGAHEVWASGRGAGIKVAVLDTGVAASHVDLNGQVLRGWDFVNDDDDAGDDHGHGTHVAGTIAALANNGVGVAGVAPGCRIIPIKVLDASGSGRNSQIAAGILKAAELGARVINLSLGGPSESETLRRAIATVAAQGVTVVAAAGNDGVSTPFYPAATADVIAVAAVDSALNKAGFSNFGDYVDIAAPGVRIASTGRAGDVVKMSGTSMAAPHVAGAVALLASAFPDLKSNHFGKAMQRGGLATTGFKGESVLPSLHLPGAFTAVPTLDLTPPGRVSGVNAKPEGPGEVALSWAASTDNLSAVRYRVNRDGEMVGTTSDTTYLDRGVSQSAQYTIVAEDADGNLADASSAITGTAGLASPLIQNLKVTRRDSSSLTIAWQTTVPMRCVLQWGDTDRLGSVASAGSTASSNHKVELKDRPRFKLHHYRVLGTTDAGEAHYSNTQKVRTKLFWLFQAPGSAASQD